MRQVIEAPCAGSTPSCLRGAFGAYARGTPHLVQVGQAQRHRQLTPATLRPGDRRTLRRLGAVTLAQCDRRMRAGHASPGRCRELQRHRQLTPAAPRPGGQRTLRRLGSVTLAWCVRRLRAAHASPGRHLQRNRAHAGRAASKQSPHAEPDLSLRCGQTLDLVDVSQLQRHRQLTLAAPCAKWSRTRR